MNNYTKDFPLLLTRRDHGKRLVYLDNAATTQKPEQVIEAVEQYYKKSTANPHRGAYALSTEATELYEHARKRVADFIKAGSSDEIVFTSGATHSLNLVALSFGSVYVQTGDEILITIAEHHSNLLPWQALAKRNGAILKYVYTDKNGQLSLSDYEKLLSPKTKIVAVSHISNVLGIINPIKEITALAHKVGAKVVVDASQSVPHIPVNVQELGADFIAFSGHKMLAPGGIGVLYGKKELLDQMDPVFLGGGIVERVSEQDVSFLDAPIKFEAGTQNVEGAVGLSAAIDYLEAIGLNNIHRREKKLTKYMRDKVRAIPNIELFSADADNQVGIISFNVKDVHPHDVSSILDGDGVAIRAGHHCAEPLMKHLKISSCCRVSLYFYNSFEDIDIFVEALSKVRGWFYES